MSRRTFLLAVGAATLAGGCRTWTPWQSPNLRFGVVSDIHLTTPQSARRFEKALRFFKRRGVDAVMVPGDLTDWGLRSGYQYVKQTWDRVFAGTEVVPLFCTGNHDYDGWWYGDMTMEMHANGYSEDDAIVRCGGMDKCWQEAFGEPFAPVRLRTVKGYDFVCSEWELTRELSPWLQTHGAKLKGNRPFFYFQHAQIKGTTSDSLDGDADGGYAKTALAQYPNCIAFTGHAHTPFNDERSIWQDEFTAISVPSISYASLPSGCENGGSARRGTSKKAMPAEPVRRDLMGSQGYLVEVFDDRVVVERWDLEAELSELSDWEIPLPLAGIPRPFDFARRAAILSAPQFPAGSELVLETRNTENRSNRWIIAMDCEFPSATMPAGSRVFDYELRAVPKDGSKPLVKRFASPAFAKCQKDEPQRQRFWFDVAELPQDRDYVIEVRARNCFGKASAPLVSAVRHGKPGLDKVRK